MVDNQEGCSKCQQFQQNALDAYAMVKRMSTQKYRSSQDIAEVNQLKKLNDEQSKYIINQRKEIERISKEKEETDSRNKHLSIKNEELNNMYNEMLLSLGEFRKKVENTFTELTETKKKYEEVVRKEESFKKAMDQFVLCKKVLMTTFGIIKQIKSSQNIGRLNKKSAELLENFDLDEAFSTTGVSVKPVIGRKISRISKKKRNESENMDLEQILLNEMNVSSSDEENDEIKGTEKQKDINIENEVIQQIVVEEKNQLNNNKIPKVSSITGRKTRSVKQIQKEMDIEKIREKYQEEMKVMKKNVEAKKKQQAEKANNVISSVLVEGIQKSNVQVVNQITSGSKESGNMISKVQVENTIASGSNDLDIFDTIEKCGDEKSSRKYISGNRKRTTSISINNEVKKPRLTTEKQIVFNDLDLSESDSDDEKDESVNIESQHNETIESIVVGELNENNSDTDSLCISLLSNEGTKNDSKVMDETKVLDKNNVQIDSTNKAKTSQAKKSNDVPKARSIVGRKRKSVKEIQKEINKDELMTKYKDLYKPSGTVRKGTRKVKNEDTITEKPIIVDNIETEKGVESNDVVKDTNTVLPIIIDDPKPEEEKEVQENDVVDERLSIIFQEAIEKDFDVSTFIISSFNENDKNNHMPEHMKSIIEYISNSSSKTEAENMYNKIKQEVNPSMESNKFVVCLVTLLTIAKKFQNMVEEDLFKRIGEYGSDDPTKYMFPLIYFLLCLNKELLKKYVDANKDEIIKSFHIYKGHSKAIAKLSKMYVFKDLVLLYVESMKITI
uniref:Fibronectin type-III domain-containing protein n=1 Tax=Parastrongyloides trichosuri TaxID=131310 RepID=A0A0N4Z7D8_PARTI